MKQSTSDLFITNCDEFIYYDDLVRSETARKRQAAPKAGPAKAIRSKNQGPPVEEALELLVNTLEALRAERGEDYAVHGSRVKQAIKRQHPGFNERAYGLRTFSDLLLEAEKRRLLRLESDKNAGGYFLLPEE